jgi:hypothetical protein
MNQLTAVLIVAIGILGGFYVGAKYGEGHPPASTPAAAANSATGNGGAGGAGFGGAAGGAGGAGGAGAGLANATIGQITAVSGTTITVHNAQTNRDVKVDVASARITKAADGTVSDLTQNTAVTVVGQAGSDGTVTATTIAIGNGAFGGGRRGAGASPSPGTGQ